MKQIKIRDKEYNCSNKVYYHIQGLESENRVISKELLGHENNELQQKEIERLKEKNEELRALYESEREVKEDYKSRNNKAIEYIEIHSNSNTEYLGAWEIQELVDILKGVDKDV